MPLALEEVLSAWARNPTEFESRAQGLQATVQDVGHELRHADQSSADQHTTAEWEQVEAFWREIDRAITRSHRA